MAAHLRGLDGAILSRS